jgi:tRNA threonylcarbamoyladenosine modification (KEOPS) complex  Pcc1 subunit
VSESRTVHLDTHAHLDGRNEISVTLTETPRGNVVVAVRPKGKRLLYKSLLSDVVKWADKRETPAKTMAALPVENGRVVHLSVSEDVDLDGQSEASVTLTESDRDYIVVIRAKHQRTTRTALLSDVALFTAARHSKYLAQQNGIAVPKPRRGLGRL